jgi:Mrp family chromosome partitioning ATPase
MASNHSSVSTTLQNLTGRTNEHSPKPVQVGDKTIRIDARTDRPVPSPHHLPDPAEPPPPESAIAQAATGTIEMGLGYVVHNNDNLQAIAEAMAGTRLTVPMPTGPLDIRPAWEVDYFRWPRLARRMLKMHFPLFDQIGNHLLAETRPTQRRVGICSTFAREGKSMMSICLSRWSALAKRRAILIDGDVDHPGLTTSSGLECGFGWRDVTESDSTLAEVMIRSVETGLTFVPANTGKPAAFQNKVLDGLATVSFQLKYEFDIVLVDLGTIENLCVHSSEGCDLVDFVVIVRDPARTSVGQLMDTRRILSNLGMNKTVVAENFARR